MTKNSKPSWGFVPRLFHWVMAGLVFWVLYQGTVMADTLNLLVKFAMVQDHKSLGFVVLVLLVFRLAWRLLFGAPGLPGTMPRWQVVASHVSHVSLYALLIAVPLTGWLMVSSSPLNNLDAFPFQVKNMVFGLFEMPDPFVEGDAELSDMFRSWHWVCTRLLILLVVIHVLAALKHHFLDKDDVLLRMIRGKGSS